jgi:hypothetical protein
MIERLRDLPADEVFDTILYIDVLEHIEDDRSETARAAAHLAPGGRLVVLAPAYAWLFSPFDAAIVHYRRYTRATLYQVAPPGLVREAAFYLDMVGLASSAANRVLLGASMPTRAQILFWDRVLVRASRLVDPLLGRRAGRSVVVVWRRP